MKIPDDQPEFESSPKDMREVFLLLFGKSDPTSERIYAAVEKLQKDRYKRVAWIVETGCLTQDQKSAWYFGDGQFTLLAASENGDKWIPVAHHPLRDLCLESGAPSARLIRGAFGEAESQ